MRLPSASDGPQVEKLSDVYRSRTFTLRLDLVSEKGILDF